jgi:hypothetical protein
LNPKIDRLEICERFKHVLAKFHTFGDVIPVSPKAAIATRGISSKKISRNMFEVSKVSLKAAEP